MSAEQLLEIVGRAPFVIIFVIVLARAVRSPLRANLDAALLFGAIALIVVMTWIELALGREPVPLNALERVLIVALPYFLLRLVQDFSQVPTWLLRLSEAGFGVLAAAFVMIGFWQVTAGGTEPPLATPVLIVTALYFFALYVYAGLTFSREALTSTGLSRRRMQAVAGGSVLLGVAVLVAGLRRVFPVLDGLLGLVLVNTVVIAGAIAYFLGFTPPVWVRRLWQEPELRAFLGRAAELPRLPNTEAIIEALENGAATSLGAPGAAVALWDETTGELRIEGQGQSVELGLDESVAGRAFTTQRAVLSVDAPRQFPAHTDVYRAYGIETILAAPITAGSSRLGVLIVYGPRPSLFAEDDLALIQLLADQAAVVLESRGLIDEAARVHAREEATRLKDDFLSAAAHDLKTPLTTLVAQAQLLERRLSAHPQTPPDLISVQRLVREAMRLKHLVLELLDAARVEEGRLVESREGVDLATLAREVWERHGFERHRLFVEAGAPVVGQYDRARMTQLLDNLLENAVKYSPAGGEVRVRAWVEGDEARLEVTDLGIGIAPADLPHVFDRFHRGENVDDRYFPGMGLGLYICRGIVEQHGGRIWATSQLGQGTTFHVALPLAVPEPLSP